MQLLDSGGLNVRGCVCIDTVAGCGDVGVQSILNLMQGGCKLMEGGVRRRVVLEGCKCFSYDFSCRSLVLGSGGSCGIDTC